MLELTLDVIVAIILVVAGLLYYFGRSFFSVPSATVKEELKAVNAIKPLVVKKEEPKLSPEEYKRAIKVLFGTQTGTAEELSKKLGQEAKSQNLPALVIDIEKFDKETLKDQEFVIFALATYGEGDPTDNARDFFTWLMDETRPNDLLKNVKYTVFGLGNKTYEHYNMVGRKVDKRMEELGGIRIYPKGEGDDDGSLEDDFRAWKKGLFPILCSYYSVQEQTNSTPDALRRQFTFKTVDPPGRGRRMSVSANTPRAGYDFKIPIYARVTVNKELHAPESDRSCRHVEFDIGHLKYLAGDHFGIFPKNDTDLVRAYAKRLNASLDTWFILESLHSDGHIGPYSVEQALAEHYDLTSPPSKAALEVLSYYAKVDKEKHKLENILKNEEEYKKYIQEPQRILLEVLTEFPSVSIPFDHFLEILPRMTPRFYSIASSPKKCHRGLHITVAVVDYTTPTGRRHKGVASSFLAGLLPNSDNEEDMWVRAFVRTSNFHLPPSPSTPIVMIGPGTGFAPFRGFLQERSISGTSNGERTSDLTSHSTAQEKGNEAANNIVYFGCRNRHIDYIYRDEIAQYLDSSLITLYTAFSRESEHKVYVQHRMRESGALLWSLIQNGAVFYVCGEALHMARDVQTEVQKILIDFGGMSSDESADYFQSLVKSERYLTDVWA